MLRGIFRPRLKEPWRAMARRRTRRGDGAVSDIIGTTAILAVTVVAVGAAAVGFASMSASTPTTPKLDVLANATASGDAFITLKHAGGASLPAGNIDFAVSASSWSAPARGTLASNDPSGLFALGTTAYISNTGHSIAAGDQVDVLLYLRGSGRLLTQATFFAAAAPSASPPVLDTFLVDLTTPPSGSAVPAGGTVLVSADVVHPAGRKAIERVYIDLSSVNGSSEYALHDDGTLGDAVASDGAYSAFVPIPPLALEGSHTLPLGAFDLDGYSNNASGSDATLFITVLPSELSQIQSLLFGFNGTNGTSGSGGSGGSGGTGPGGPMGPGGLPGGSGGTGGEPVPQSGPVGPTGATGATGGAGGNGTAGGSGGNGTSGANGTSGTNGSSYVPPLAEIPDIVSMTPTWGPPGTIVYISGFSLGNVTSVTMGIEGAFTAFSANFAPDPGANPGEGLIFLVPTIADGQYVVNVTTSTGGWATAPTYFHLLGPQPRIDSISPASARSYTQVNVTGANFTAVGSVTLMNPLVGSIAVPWTVTDDGHLSFVTHPGLPPGTYDVNVSTGLKWAVATLGFEALAPLEPMGLSLSPTTAVADDVVTINGLNLETVGRVTLSQTNASRVIEAGWYMETGSIKMVVPVAAAPEGPWNLTYDVNLTGTFTGSVTVPDRLTVLPTPGPTITVFTPLKGEPFTQVNIFGTNFVNVKSVKFGETAVYFATSSSQQILAVTHAGLAPGNYTINVTTGTGFALSSAQFQALPLKIVPLYNRSLISSWAVNTSLEQSDNNALVTNTTVKVRAAPGWEMIGIEMTLVEYEFQSGSTATKPLSKYCGQTTDRVSTWSITNQNVHTLNTFANEFDYYFGATLRNATNSALVKTYVITTAENSNFILPAGTFTHTVIDAGFPSMDNFRTCAL